MIYGQKKGWESNCQFESRALKVRNRLDLFTCIKGWKQGCLCWFPPQPHWEEIANSHLPPILYIDFCLNPPLCIFGERPHVNSCLVHNNMPNLQVHWKLKLVRVNDFDRNIWGSKLNISTFDFIKISTQIIIFFQMFDKMKNNLEKVGDSHLKNS